LLHWAAYWAAAVATKVGLLREWRLGEMGSCREIAGALPVVAGLIERENQARAQPFAGSGAAAQRFLSQKNSPTPLPIKKPLSDGERLFVI